MCHVSFGSFSIAAAYDPMTQNQTAVFGRLNGLLMVVLLFATGEFAHWSLLANLLTPVFTAAMFVGEYLVRYWLHPDFERVSLQLALQAWRSHGAPQRRAQDSSQP